VYIFIVYLHMQLRFIVKAATYTGTIGSDAHNSGPTPTVAANPLHTLDLQLIIYVSYSNLHLHAMHYLNSSVQPRQRLYPGVNSSQQYARMQQSHHIQPTNSGSTLSITRLQLSSRSAIASSSSCGYVGHACITIARVRHICVDDNGKQI
jgi:hypothetical protein